MIFQLTTGDELWWTFHMEEIHILISPIIKYCISVLFVCHHSVYSQTVSISISRISVFFLMVLFDVECCSPSASLRYRKYDKSLIEVDE